MKPRITLLTLGVDDLERSLRFYRDGMGLQTEGIVGKEFECGAVVFFDLQPGLKLALWPRKSLAQDSGLTQAAPSSTEFTIGHNVALKAEVDAVTEQARARWRGDRQTAARYILGRLCCLFPGSGSALMGDSLEPSVGPAA